MRVSLFVVVALVLGSLFAFVPSSEVLCADGCDCADGSRGCRFEFEENIYYDEDGLVFWTTDNGESCDFVSYTIEVRWYDGERYMCTETTIPMGEGEPISMDIPEGADTLEFRGTGRCDGCSTAICNRVWLLVGLNP